MEGEAKRESALEQRQLAQPETHRLDLFFLHSPKHMRKLSIRVTQLGRPPLMGRLTAWMGISSSTSFWKVRAFSASPEVDDGPADMLY